MDFFKTVNYGNKKLMNNTIAFPEEKNKKIKKMFICNESNCLKTFKWKYVLQKHIGKIHEKITEQIN